MTRASRGISPIQEKARGKGMKKDMRKSMAPKPAKSSMKIKAKMPLDSMSVGAAMAPQDATAGLRTGMKKGGMVGATGAGNTPVLKTGTPRNPIVASKMSNGVPGMKKGGKVHHREHHDGSDGNVAGQSVEEALKKAREARARSQSTMTGPDADRARRAAAFDAEYGFVLL